MNRQHESRKHDQEKHVAAWKSKLGKTIRHHGSREELSDQGQDGHEQRIAHEASQRHDLPDLSVIHPEKRMWNQIRRKELQLIGILKGT